MQSKEILVNKGDVKYAVNFSMKQGSKQSTFMQLNEPRVVQQNSDKSQKSIKKIIVPPKMISQSSPNKHLELKQLNSGPQLDEIPEGSDNS